MPRLRLFGPIAEAAGTRAETVEGSSIEEVLDAARSRYGAGFSEQVPICRVWVNGEAPTPGLLLTESDEVALLPPVSGG